MAIINQIGGISTGSLTGVLKGPLDKLFKKDTGQFSYKYPSNLGDDPTRIHAVHFTLFNVKPRQMDVAKVVRVGQDFTNQIKDSMQKEGILGGIATKGKQAWDGVKSALVSTKDMNIDINSAVKAPTGDKIATNITLYMPDTLAMNYHAEYSELTLVEATKGFNRLFETVGSVAKDVAKGAAGDISMNNLPSEIDKYGPSAVEGALGIIDSVAGTELTALGLNAMGVAINPQVQLLYKGLGLRKFTMEFIFTPNSQEESDQVSAIINSFIYASSPTVSGIGGMYFIPPSQFEISFHMAQSGTFSGLASMLQKAGNGIIPGVPLGTKIADELGINKQVENNRLFKVGRCVLEDVSVDYAPNGWAAYKSGAPVQTRLNLSFMEMDILDRTRMYNGEVR